MPAISPRDRISVELPCRQHMIGQDRIITHSPRPAAIGEAQQTYIGAGRCREIAGGTPRN